MGPEERIIAEEDRLFLTSLGNWTGDGVWWKPAPWSPYWACRFDLTPEKSIAKETLAYPAVLIEPKGTATFQLYFGTVIPPNLTILTLTVTDGKYLFTKTYSGWPPPPEMPQYINFDTPSDWKKKKAYIEIKTEAVPPANSAMAFFYPSVIETWEPPPQPTRTQYLPIMGIG